MADGTQTREEIENLPAWELPPPIEPVHPPRMRVLWILCLALFALLVAGALMPFFEGDAGSEPSWSQAESTLSLTTEVAQFQERYADLAGNDLSAAEPSGLRPFLERSAKYKRTSTEAARLHAVLSVELNEPAPTAQDVEVLLLSSDPADRAFAQIYIAPSLTPGQMDAIRQAVGTEDTVSRVAVAQGYERAGKPEVRDELFSGDRAVPILIVMGFGVAALGLGIMVWIGYAIGRASRSIRALGSPLADMQPLDADLTAFRVVVLMIGFFIVAQGMALGLSRYLGEMPATVVGTALFILAAPFIIGVPLARRKLTLREIIGDTSRPMQKALWGVAGFLANLPLMLIVVLLASPLNERFAPSHPATEALSGSPSIVTVLSLFVLAAIFAPLWEEVVFRGMLFPAISRVTGSFFVGVLCSSLLFAAIHPQGPALWLGLAAVGATAALLAHHTKSLIPSIVMHAVHNAAILTFGLVIT